MIGTAGSRTSHASMPPGDVTRSMLVAAAGPAQRSVGALMEGGDLAFLRRHPLSPILDGRGITAGMVCRCDMRSPLNLDADA